MLVSARILPANDVVDPSVAELPTCQNTLHSDPPLITATEEPLAVVKRAAGLEDEDGVGVALRIERERAGQLGRRREAIDAGSQRFCRRDPGPSDPACTPGWRDWCTPPSPTFCAAAGNGIRGVDRAGDHQAWGKAGDGAPGADAEIPGDHAEPVLVTVDPPSTAKLWAEPSDGAVWANAGTRRKDTPRWRRRPPNGPSTH